jgi:hypothetical protein
MEAYRTLKWLSLRDRRWTTPPLLASTEIHQQQQPLFAAGRQASPLSHYLGRARQPPKHFPSDIGYFRDLEVDAQDTALARHQQSSQREDGRSVAQPVQDCSSICGEKRRQVPPGRAPPGDI